MAAPAPWQRAAAPDRDDPDRPLGRSNGSDAGRSRDDLAGFTRSRRSNGKRYAWNDAARAWPRLGHSALDDDLGSDLGQGVDLFGELDGHPDAAVARGIARVRA